ncbi:MAG TPA: ABC transporter permease [Ruminococcus flavefaciens]|nr:ABC transporter permease [Ruminococcus flavefaciens]
MVKLLKIEFRKMHNSGLFLAGFAVVTLICLGISAIELSAKGFGIKESSYTDFMIYNATFVVVKFFAPLLMVLLAASVWGSEYANGMTKTFMLCKCSKSQFYISKNIFLLIMCAVISVLSFGVLTAVGIIRDSAGNTGAGDVWNMAKVYMLSAAGLIPITLITVLASIFLGDFQKSFACGLVVLLLSIAFDSVGTGSYLSPTHFLSCSPLTFYGTEKPISYAVLAAYIVILYLVGLFSFRKKDIWS